MVYAQDEAAEKVIILDEVIIYPTKAKILKSNIKKEVKTSCKGFASVISLVTPTKNAQYVKGIEFFFNNKWSDSKNEGFYLRPIIVNSVNNKPGNTVLYRGYDYFVTKKVGQRVYCDFSEAPAFVGNLSSFFIGVEFVEKRGTSPVEDFNITLGTSKKVNYSFVKGHCNTCQYAPLNISPKEGLLLKYRLFYD
ncbi:MULTISPECIES: hypothetical protein [unclassified Dysgonomonas]|uniref:hypothetical protein n=1 Tax=unclassified Dysgonomonas TaxID=2630389 RepID=UPI0024733B4A|nr:MULTISPECIES: hypothetical protein [unclassified Dysgonomonas]